MFSEGLDGKALCRDENLFFNGLYQVNKIESRFDSGQFLQTLFCSRFNNQQGEGADPLLLTSAAKSITSIKNSVDILGKGKKTVEEIQKGAEFLQNKKLYKRAGEAYSKGVIDDYL